MLATSSEADILKRVIRPEEGGMSPQVARELLRLGFQESDHSRMAELSRRASEGSLTESEQSELDGYINISHFIAFLHSKARIALRNEPHNPAA